MTAPRRFSAAALARLGGELMIIGVGVLTALAGQSWWENRAVEQDRERTLRLLLAHADLENSGRLPPLPDTVRGRLIPAAQEAS